MFSDAKRLASGSIILAGIVGLMLLYAPADGVSRSADNRTRAEPHQPRIRLRVPGELILMLQDDDPRPGRDTEMQLPHRLRLYLQSDEIEIISPIPQHPDPSRGEESGSPD
jgi:hypothetical protein